ncbi:amidohydrolase family protein [Thermoflavifilum thermophilum]|uniref:Cytosine/adenosine deaminase n=1 Tax=Thermoflavifilum thermophilum TaxID=1393122 RepID=A0A1I7N8T2_9BACT|nr:amidohydrolase family protein [Thermoflavifilum thermophilum]SFV30993.1 Cytosine/adenosine deaminase [Thermoflavifilum thermophilum]
MKSRVLTADFIFDGWQLWPHAAIAIDEQGCILQFIPQPDERQLRKADYFAGLLCPGFINVHCHTELSYLKDCIPRGTGLVNFILKLMETRHDPAFSPDIKLQAITLADQQMQQAGIVAVGDIVNTLDSLPVKQSTNLYYHHFVECMGVPDDVAQQRFEQAQKLAATWKAHTSFPATIIPHAPYSVSDTLFRYIALQDESLISIHNQETAAESEWFLTGQGSMRRLYDTLGISFHQAAGCGNTSLRHVLPFFFEKNTSAHKPCQLILVHNTFTPATDIQWATEQFQDSIYWCICPKANLYIEQQLPPLEALMTFADDRIVMGTDSLASNDTLSILEEMKCLQQHFPSIGLENLLRWATWNGAKALHCESWLGSFTPGKKPGVVHVSSIHQQRLSSESRSQRIA